MSHIADYLWLISIYKIAISYKTQYAIYMAIISVPRPTTLHKLNDDLLCDKLTIHSINIREYCKDIIEQLAP